MRLIAINGTFTYLKLPNLTKLNYFHCCTYVDEIEGNAALAIIEENPTNFGVWDRVLDPASAKVRVEKAFKQKNSSQIVFTFLWRLSWLSSLMITSNCYSHIVLIFLLMSFILFILRWTRNLAWLRVSSRSTVKVKLWW